MYLDNLNETEKVISEYNTRNNNIKNAGTLTTYLERINSAVQEISEQMALSAEAKKTLVPRAGMEEEKIEALYGLLAQLQADLEDGNDINEGSKSLKTTAKDFRESENKKWSDAVMSRATTQSSLLQQLKNFTEDPVAASTIISRLNTYLTQMPKDVATIQDYGKMLNHAENIVQRVGRTPTIMGFIQKVTRGQATLSDLDDEVNKWITDHHLEKKLRITM